MDLGKFVEAVNLVINNPKILVGAESPTWQRRDNRDDLRLKFPLEIEGEQRGAHLEIVAYPEYEPRPKFSIGISCLEKIVCRLDFDKDEEHVNRIIGKPLSRIRGPHWHSWELNRSEVSSILYYDRLPLAVPFTTAQKFDAILRWYCAERKIALGAHAIEYPARERLL